MRRRLLLICLSFWALYNSLPAQQAAFLVTQSAGCSPLSVQFDGRISSGNGPFVYLWDFGNGQTIRSSILVNPEVSFSQVGIFTSTLRVIDANGDTSAVYARNITVHPVPEINLPEDTLLCEGPNAILNVLQDSAKYLWSGGDTLPTIRPRESGIYIVDSYYPGTGCRASDSIFVDIRQAPKVSLSGPSQICAGDSLRISANLIDSASTFIWSPQGTSQSSTYWETTANESVYVSLLVRDSLGCEAEVSYETQVIELPEFEVPSQQLCEGDTLLLSAETVSAHNVPAQTSYLWLNELGELLSDEPQFAVTESGNYEVICEYRSCVNEDTFSVDFISLPSSNQYQEISICAARGETVELDAGIYDSYLWEADSSQGRYFETSDSGMFYFQVFSAPGCSSRDSILIINACDPRLYIPNAFSPNGDGINDLFVMHGEFLQNLSINIFDRWGKLVFQNRKQDQYWDGTDQGRLLPESVYYYHVSYEGKGEGENLKYEKKGTISLIR